MTIDCKKAFAWAAVASPESVITTNAHSMRLPNAIMNSAPAKPPADWELDYKDVYTQDAGCEQAVIPLNNCPASD